MKKDLLTVLFLQNSQLLYRIAFNKSQNHEFSEDIVQQVFTIATEKLNILKSHPNPTAWLIQTEKYVLKNEMRKLAKLQSAFAALEKNTSTSSTNESTDENTETVLQLQDILSPDDYSLLYSIYVQKKSYRELAIATGSSETALRKRCDRARKKIQKNFS